MESQQRKPYNANQNEFKGRLVSMAHGKVPPQALDLEEAVLGALMIDKSSEEMFEVFSTADVFYKDAHKHVFQAILNLNGKGENIDILTVSAELKRMGKLEAAGGDFYLIGLTQKVSSSAHIEYHARILLQMYMKREAIRKSNEIIEKAYDDTVDVFDMMDWAESGFTQISEMASTGKKMLTWAQMLDRVAVNVETLTKHGDKILGVSTGFWKLDGHFGGWQQSDLYVIGARPGAGKTAFTVASMLGAAVSGSAVGYLSMEMSGVQLATRGVAVNSDLHLNQLTRTGFDKPKYFNSLLDSINKIRNLPIYIDDTPVLTLLDIRRKVRQMKRRHGIKLLFLDYLQLAAGGDKDVRYKITEMCYGLKALAKELDIAIVALSQLSRDVEKRSPPRPRLSDLAESGAIEAAADGIIFIYRPAYYKLEPDYSVLNESENTEFIVAKFRNGGVGTIGLWYDENKTKFSDDNPKLMGGNDFPAVDWERKAQERAADYRPTANEAFGNDDVPY